VFCIKKLFDAYSCILFMLTVGAASYMFLRFRFPYRAPRELLHGLHAATRLSNELMPGWSTGQRSTSVR
jgi:hypothetical protein